MTTLRFDVDHLSLTRHGRDILQEVTLTVASGEIICLLGPSGSGKSSLLRCLNRLTEPPPQTVFMNKEDITTLNVVALRQQVGMVFQKAALFPGTVADNLAFGPQLSNQTVSAARAAQLLTLVDLPTDFATRNVDTLSGGEAQRVSVARTLANQPKALLLDEPTSALDPTAMRRVQQTILKLRQTLNLTVLWVTHNVEEAQQVADRVYLLVNGRVVDEGTPEHLLRPGSKHLLAVFAAGQLE